MDILLKYFDDFTPAQLKQFELLEGLYKEWNEKINVVSRKDIDQIYLHHVLHSLSIAAIVDFKPGADVIDIGCGGGFPGVPLAIFFPETRFHMVDSIGKKLKVVEAVVEGAGIANITTQHCRAEDIKNKKFDFAVSRAVAPLKELWTWAKPLLKKEHKNEINNGLICLKGGDLHQEIFESNTRPKMMSVFEIFGEEYFKEKFIIYVSK
ncbi:MAG: 16S rRNA (guanine(527)-N(7))-methyltransferase RsmG [Chitinophagaceae bacterium]|nr:16S rRNA (guanine(527)-N(7))-methyltransferase RsmG [Chitinophagaceae bacterium]